MRKKLPQNKEVSSFDPAKLTLSERNRIARRARRNIQSEIALFLTSGFAVFMIALFWFGKLTILPLAEFLGARPTVVWVGLSALLSVFLASVHGLIGSRKIAQARQLEFMVHQFDGEKKRAEIEMRTKAMKSKNTLGRDEDNGTN